MDAARRRDVFWRRYSILTLVAFVGVNIQLISLRETAKQSLLLQERNQLSFLAPGRQNNSLLEGAESEKEQISNALRGTSNQYILPPTKRGGGLLTTHSGCRITRWVYTHERGTRRLFRECRPPQPQNEQLRNSSQLRDNDTIFVPFTAIQQFVDEILDGISNDVVIISGQTHIVSKAPNAAIKKLLANDHVVHWFCQNLPVYGGENPYDDKVSPFPYGLKEKERHGWDTFEDYKRVFFESLTNGNITKKTTSIFVGPLGNTTAGRESIPQTTEEMQPREFFLKMAASKYTLSPNGDRPECYRHYEALGLGTVPITELDPFLFRHLPNGSVIHNTTDWNLALFERTLSPHPRVNRNLIREDYWMDYADKVVGSQLNWNDFKNGNGLAESETKLMSLLDNQS